jgi:hypothetical protein
MKISLGVITRGEVNIETVYSLLHLFRSTPHQFHINFHKGTYVQELRNQCLRAAREVDADYLFFVDSDIVFPADGLNKLLSWDKDVIGGMYNMKSLPLKTTIKPLDDEGNRLMEETISFPDDKIFKVYGLPTGFMLIRLKAIEKLENPFDFDRDTEGLIGEDINFCIHCREIGVELWCDPTIKIGHIGYYLY